MQAGRPHGPNTSANAHDRDLQRRLERYYLGRGRAVRVGPPTRLIFGTLAKYLTDDIAPADHDRVVADYLDGHRTVRAINAGKLEYYSVVRATMGIVAAIDGHDHWSRPGLVEELEGYVSARVR